MLGAAAGVLFGVSDVAIKALTGIAGNDGILAIAVSPWLDVTICASVAAFFASARGLQDGDAVSVIAITGTAANITCIVAAASSSSATRCPARRSASCCRAWPSCSSSSPRR